MLRLETGSMPEQSAAEDILYYYCAYFSVPAGLGCLGPHSDVCLTASLIDFEPQYLVWTVDVSLALVSWTSFFDSSFQALHSTIMGVGYCFMFAASNVTKNTQSLNYIIFSLCHSYCF